MPSESNRSRLTAVGAAVGVAMTLSLTSPAAEAAGPRPLFQMPVPCGQTWRASTYWEHWNYDQDAIDLAQRDEDQHNLSEGEFAVAAAAGTVMAVYTSNGEHRVSIDHGGGWQTDYIHLESLPPLSVGQAVAQGQVVGRVSNSGAVSMHLHYNQIADGTARRVSFNGTLIDTHAGNLASWDTYGTDNAEALTSLNCPGNSFAAFNQNGMRHQLIYKPGNGQVKIVRLDADGTGTTTMFSGDWGRQWTHIVPFYVAGQPFLFRYRGSSGEVRFDRVNLQANGVTTVGQGTWWAGWTHFTPFALGGTPYFIAYDSLHGYANIDRINVEGSGSTTIGGGTWTKGWTHFVPYVMGPTQYLLLYKGGSGRVEVNSITGSGNNVGLTQVWSDTWSTGWSHLVALAHEGTRRLFAYRASTGEVSYGQLRANGQGSQHLGSGVWTTNWTSITPMLMPDGEAGLFIYGAGTGSAQVRRFNAAGTGSSNIWSAAWTTGWR
jgi:hypothetical protein